MAMKIIPAVVDKFSVLAIGVPELSLLSEILTAPPVTRAALELDLSISSSSSDESKLITKVKTN
jgi:hypothetical protein